MFRCSLIIFLGMLALTSCGSNQTLPSYPRTILGTITRRGTSMGERMLVEQNPGASIGDKIFFNLSGETQIFQRINGDLQAQTSDYLAVGQRVEVWAEGGVAESWPGQAEATVIVIIDPDEESIAEAGTLMPPAREPDVSGMITQATNTVLIDQNLVLFITPTTQFLRRSGNTVEPMDARDIKEGQRVDVWVDKIQNQQAQVIVVIHDLTPVPETESACFLPIPPDYVVVQPSPFPKDATILENEGHICFFPLSEDDFDVYVASSGCYATSCTLIFERTGNIDIDQDTFTIQFNSRYVIKAVGNERESGAVCECAADCSGAGSLRFKTNELQDGIYSIKLGETQIGQLVVPFYGTDICWTTESIATPIPSSTPYVYP